MSDSEATPPSPHPDLIEARLDSISVTNVGFIVFLKGEDEGRVLPIFIGANEAQSIALALGDEPPPRPMTHDLLKSMLDSLEAAVTRIEITALREGTFFGKVHMTRAGIEETEFDARPSDAIALAVRYGAPLFVAREVFEEAAVAVSTGTASGSEGKEPLEPAAQSPTAAPPASLSPAEKLRADLDAAVRDERYEEAARLRDTLRRLGAGNEVRGPIRQRFPGLPRGITVTNRYAGDTPAQAAPCSLSPAITVFF